jgi:hypothetical protein
MHYQTLTLQGQHAACKPKASATRGTYYYALLGHSSALSVQECLLLRRRHHSI